MFGRVLCGYFHNALARERSCDLPRRCSTSDGVFMNPVRASLSRWGVTVASALMLCAIFVAPALAAGDGGLVLRHSVGTSTGAFVAFGPLGPGCPPGPTPGPDCTFFTSSFTGSGKSEPGGHFTVSGTTTVLFGLNGFFFTPNGAADASGNPAGGCVPIFQTSHVVYANGSIDQNDTGSSCCGLGSCDGQPLGPPSTAHLSSVCTSGTGKYAGIQCSGESTGSSIDGVHSIGRGESVSTK
jgi:hypothetical protein